MGIESQDVERVNWEWGVAHHAMTIVTLEVLNQSVHVLVFLLLILDPLLSWVGMGRLLVKLSALNVG